MKPQQITAKQHYGVVTPRQETTSWLFLAERVLFLFQLEKVLFFKVSVYPKIDHFSKKTFFSFSDRSYCNLSFKKNSMKKD